MMVVRKINQGSGYPALYHVGHWQPDGSFNLLLEVDDCDEAMQLCSFLNGGPRR